MCRLASVTVPPTGRAPAQVRRWVARLLNRWQLADPDGDVLLMISEIVTNAVRYAPAAITVTLAVAEGVLEAGVADRDPAPGHVHFAAGPTDGTDPEGLPEGGRGLRIVSALAEDWGVTPLPGGKQVWFRYRLAEPWEHAPACVCGRAQLPALRLASGFRAVANPGPWDDDA